MKEKLAIIVCAFPPQGGGIGNNAYYHAQYLSAEYQVAVFTPDFQNIKKLKVERFQLFYLPIRMAFGKAGFLFSLFRRLKEFDVIHLYYPFFGTDLVVALFKLFNRKQKLVVHYEMDAVGHGVQKIIFWIYLKMFLPLIVRLADRIGVLSWDNAEHSYLRRFLEKYKDKFAELPNGVNADIFKPGLPITELVEKFNLRTGDKVIIFVGGLDSQHFFKGVDVLIESFVKLADNYSQLKLLIVGDGNKREYYEKLAKKTGLGDRIIFAGWVNNNLLPQYYNLADIFALPSTERTESFGIVTAEAQACELPAVVSNWPGSRATLIDGKTGLLVEPNNVEDLTSVIRRFLADDILREKMGRAGRQQVLENYHWPTVAEKISNLYKSI